MKIFCIKSINIGLYLLELFEHITVVYVQEQ